MFNFGLWNLVHHAAKLPKFGNFLKLRLSVKTGHTHYNYIYSAVFITYTRQFFFFLLKLSVGKRFFVLQCPVTSRSLCRLDWRQLRSWPDRRSSSCSLNSDWMTSTPRSETARSIYRWDWFLEVMRPTALIILMIFSFLQSTYELFCQKICGKEKFVLILESIVTKAGRTSA